MSETENQPENRAAAPETEVSAERLDELGADIEAVRQRADDVVEGSVADPGDEGERRFIESGDEGPVDDTIVPPG